MNTLLRTATTAVALLVVAATPAAAWDPLPIADDPLVRMPGTQPEQGVQLESPGRCLNCHGGYNTQVEPGFNWKGSMMAQAARDFLFWSCLTVAAQDSIWAVGRPNAVDICERCHFPQGWVEGRSDPPDVSAMTGSDYDGVQCDFCHRLQDPFFVDTFAGVREGSDWLGYWDETNASETPSQTAASATYDVDAAEAPAHHLFNGGSFFGADLRPFSPQYTENGSGQYFVSADAAKRAPFADAAARHQMLYSRYHKSKYFCSTCHDVSNPVLANLDFAGTVPGDGTTVLPTEEVAAHSYYHVERTFSEFMLSDYGLQGGAPGIGPFAPGSFATSLPDDAIGKCQDCHMRDVVGQGCNKNGVPVRPDDSVEHPQSGQPLHDLTGGNVFVSTVLASAVPGSPNYDSVNDSLLHQGPEVLTLDLSQGEGIDPVALLAGADRAMQQLQLAASIHDLSYDAASGALSFRVQNQTGHKLISGFPEGRRMWLNVRAWSGGSLIYELNPYDATVGTLKGLEHSSSSPPLAANEVRDEHLVYEMHPTSGLTGEEETFHFALATGRYKDNRIPPKGFRIDEAAARQSEPVWDGLSAPDYYTADEYAGGYDQVDLTIAAGADAVDVQLYYQTTSREYVEFLRDEINGTGTTLASPTPSGETEAYVIQTDPFFARLRAWGDTLWQLWTHNMNVPGAAPVLMTSASIGGGGGCTAPTPTLLSAVPGHQIVTVSWSDELANEPALTGYRLYYDQAGKAQAILDLGPDVTSYTDTGLTNGQEYCYTVTALTDCESGFSNVLCATPTNQNLQAGVALLETGRYETTGQGRDKVTTFVLTDTFTAGETVVLRAHVTDSAGVPVSGAAVELTLTGPETAVLASSHSDAEGVAEASWSTSAPNKQGKGGTALGTYTATTTGVSADGYTWDGVETATSFTLQ